MKEKLKILLTADVDGAVGGINIWAKHIVSYWENSNESKVELETIPSGRKDFTSFTQNTFHRVYDGVKAYSVFIRNVRKRLDENHYDILHMTSSASYGLIRDYLLIRIARKRRIKTVLHFHFGLIPELSTRRNWEWKLLLKVSQMADKVIVLDRKSLDTLLASGITNAVQVSNPISPLVLEQVKSLGNLNNKEEKIILYVGQCYKAKGVIELANACKGIKDITLSYIGSCSDEMAHEIREIEGDEHFINILGIKPYSEVIKAMNSCMVFVLPSYSEGFPNVILEAMACGCAIISTSVGAIPEMLGNNCGIVVAPKDIAALQSSILLLVENKELRVSYGNEAKKKVMEYDISRVWSSLEDIWVNL